jgi:hypothetical protein
MGVPGPHAIAKILLIRLTYWLDFLIVMEQAFIIIIKPDTTLLRKDDVPEVEDLFHLKTVVDVRDDFLDKGRRIHLGLPLGGRLFREKLVVDLGEIVRLGLSDGLGELINGLLLRNRCHERPSYASFTDSENTTIDYTTNAPRAKAGSVLFPVRPGMAIRPVTA